MTTEQNGKDELLARLELIERMMVEGRETTANHGWVFLLWGAAFLVAIAWMTWLPHGGLAWAVTMPVTAIMSGILGRTMRHYNPRTPAAHAISGIWIAVSVALFLYTFSVTHSGHAEMHAFWAAVETLLGVANCASAIVLRWRAQMAVAILWFVAAAASCFVPGALLMPILVVAILIGQVGFGLYLMYLESRDRKMAVRHG